MNYTTSQPALIDAAHLQLLSPELAANTDIVLCTTVGGVETELPAHAKVLSEHSQVLSEMITACDVPSKARICMAGDSPIGLEAMLTVIYRPLARGFEATMLTSQQLLAALIVSHKYAMAKATSAVELQLIVKVKHAAQRPLVNHETLDSIISYAAAGEKFELRQLRAYSEAYLALSLNSLPAGGRSLLELSKDSLCRIATALAKRFKSARDDIEGLVPAFKDCKERHAQYEAIITQALRHNVNAPDCPCKDCNGSIAVVKVSKRRKKIRCSNKRCRRASERRSILPHFEPRVIDSMDCFFELFKLLEHHTYT